MKFFSTQPNNNFNLINFITIQFEITSATKQGPADLIPSAERLLAALSSVYENTKIKGIIFLGVAKPKGQCEMILIPDYVPLQTWRNALAFMMFLGVCHLS